MPPDRAFVCVVGAGVAGLASALAAAQAGLRVALYAAEPGVSEIEAHVDVVPSMLRDLVRLGVGDAIVRAGFPYRRTQVMTSDGVALFAIEAKHLAGARYPAALGIALHELHRLLVQACEDAGVRFHWTARIRAIDMQAQGARVLLPDRTIHPQLVVLACGARAHLREDLLEVQPPIGTTSWTYLVCRRPPAIFEPIRAFAGSGRKAHAVPIGSSHLGLSINDLSAALTPDALEAELSQLPGALAELSALSRSGPTRRQIAFGMATPRDAGATLIAVGECACALPPHFGQSAAQAIEDAVVLKEVLQCGAIESAAATFEARRCGRRHRVLELTARAAQWDRAPEAQTDLRLLAEALDDLHPQPA